MMKRKAYIVEKEEKKRNTKMNLAVLFLRCELFLEQRNNRAFIFFF